VDLSAYAIDGLAPARVERPTTTADVATVIGAAHRANEAVVLHGGGTRIGVGNSPARYDIAVDLRALTGIVEHSAPDLVCSVRAGTTLAELASTLALNGQRWPVDVADPERATVGGTIASAAPSPSRLRYQHPRDWVIGCEAVLGDGTITRAGGRVVKNVTGYDLTRLYSGSFGTLAAITEVSLKLVAVDEVRRTFRLRREALGSLASTLRRTFPFEAIVLEREGAIETLSVAAAGPASSVERAAAVLKAHGTFEEVGVAEWDAVCARVLRADLVARCSVPPGAEADLLPQAHQAYIGAGIGYVCGSREPDELARLRESCERMGGAMVLERAPSDTRRSLGTWGKPRTPQRVAEALKRRFDPNGVLAPGRMPA
jgi:glycolate oxidase FAD binding subunit